MNVNVKAIGLLGMVFGLIGACGPLQGQACQKDSDCGSNLSCQPIVGRASNFCCPTPPESSGYENCHPTDTTPVDDTTPTAADAGDANVATTTDTGDASAE
jgi:hypothetical protein